MAHGEAEAPAFIVGIGASAGGLEAIEAFFSNMPERNDCGFVVIQHLSPDYKSLMVEILSKRTDMPVYRAEDGMAVRPASVYLIPPKKNLTIFHGKLLLRDQEPSRGINLPIDVFLRSLAEDHGEKAVAVILSGTGSDGMRGIRAIKQAGGMIMVQDPPGAKFDGMPRAALSTGLPDFVLPPEEMAEQLISFTAHPHLAKQQREALDVNADGMTRIFALLREQCKVDFTHYKASTVMRRVDRRMTITGVETTAEYAAHLEQTPSETTTLFRELLIGVTSFFRDPEVFQRLQTDIIPGLIDAAPDRELRLWVAGCSTGEEAYTFAILVREALDERDIRRDVKIFATDIDRDALQFAAVGSYPESIAADIPPDLLRKHFFTGDGHVQVCRAVREMVVFAQHNLVKDPPFTSIDLISCRNLLIYLQPVLQTKVLEYFLFSLRTNGILLLGTSETVGDLARNLAAVDSKAKIFKSTGRRTGVLHSNAFSPGDTRFREAQRQAGDTRASAHPPAERILERFLEAVSPTIVPVAVIVNEELEVQHVVGDSRPYMRFPQGKPTAEVDKVVVKDLSIPFVTGLQRVFREGTQLEFRGVTIRDGEHTRIVDLTLLPLEETRGQPPLAAGLIQERPAADSPSEDNRATYDLSREAEQRIADLEQELQFSRENLQATIEELETSNEELQATNEELLASNEELQSTNEELQSTNEELYTVNAEYNEKIVELSELTGDVENILASSSIGFLLLDENDDVRRFSPAMNALLDVNTDDIGKSVTRIRTRLKDFDMTEACRSVGSEWEVETEENRWFLLRSAPYTIAPDQSSGTVVSAVEITDRKEMQMSLEEHHQVTVENEARYRLLLENVHAIPWEYCIPDDYWTYVAPQVARILGYSPEEWTNYAFWLDRLHPEDRSWAANYCEACSARGESHVFEYRFRAKSGDYLWLRDVVSVEMAEGKPVRIRGFMIDITDRKRSEDELARLAEEKAVLLRELTHRVKNNLATLDGLLSFQIASAEDRHVSEALESARLRLQIIQSVYDLLHDQYTARGGSVAEYLDSLIQQLAQVLPDQERVSLEVQAEPLNLRSDMLLPLGIITNELITNSAKHAFPGDRAGVIQISLMKEEAGGARLVVSDNGAGMDERQDEEEPPADGVGLTLVRSLAQQIRGHSVIDIGSHGARAEITFPIPEVERDE